MDIFVTQWVLGNRLTQNRWKELGSFSFVVLLQDSKSELCRTEIKLTLLKDIGETAVVQGLLLFTFVFIIHS